MFRILKKTFDTGLVTISYPDGEARISGRFRGAPQIDFSNLRNARAAADACPTGALSAGHRVTLDLGLCIFCGECAEADPANIRMSTLFDLATTDRNALITTAEYDSEGGELKKLTRAVVEEQLRTSIQTMLGGSLAIREVDAGSCNGCEVEISALNNPVYDLERLGIHFVASPRHADMLLVTGPVTRNMELALRKTYQATPDPKVVVAVGACGISGGIYGMNYATVGGVSEVIPVDVFIPGCPPRPHALLSGILLAVGKIAGKK